MIGCVYVDRKESLNIDTSKIRKVISGPSIKDLLNTAISLLELSIRPGV